MGQERLAQMAPAERGLLTPMCVSGQKPDREGGHLAKVGVYRPAFTFPCFLLTFALCLNVRRAQSRLSGKTIPGVRSVPSDVS
jgi:hypothetical protein